MKPNDVDRCFVEDLISIRPLDDEIQEFSGYALEIYYILIQTLYSPPPPNMRVRFKATTNQTTHSCESLHSRLNRMINSSHPNVYDFIGTLKDIQMDTYIKIRNDAGDKKKKTAIE